MYEMSRHHIADMASLNTLIYFYKVKHSKKPNPAAVDSPSAKFGGSPAKQGRALTSSILVGFF